MTELAVPFTAGFYTDTASTSSTLTNEVPGVYPVGISGHGYPLDLKSGAFKHESIPTLRPVFIQADTLGEKNINPESLWRASQDTWHHGAGQPHADKIDSDTARYHASKGIDPWTRGQMQLLPDTAQARASANTNLAMAVAGGYLYVIDGNTLAYTTDLTTFTTVTGTPAAGALAVCSDGDTVYVAFSGQGVWTTTRGAAAATQYVTGTDSLTALGYVKGRLMAAKGRSLYNIVSAVPAALPTSLFDHPNTDFAWVGFAEGAGFIYAAGFSGDKSLVYRITIQPDGTALAVPIQAAQLPDGEIVRAIGSYLGFILLGTDRGVRVAQPASNGDLTLSALLPTGVARCFEGQDRFIWFGWDNYDTTSTGAGRIDLTVINDGGAPGYASDLMITGQGNVRDLATFTGKRVLAVSGLGFYKESVNKVTTGYLDSGQITYDLPDQKIALYLDVKHDDPLVGQHAAWLSTDGAGFQLIGVHDGTGPEETFTIPEYRGETFEIREVLTSDGTTGTPVVRRHTLLSNPAVDTGYYLTVPLLLTEQEDSGRHRDVGGELAFLKALRDSGIRVTYQEGGTSFSVTAEDLTWMPTHLTKDRSAFNGTCVMKLKTI